MQAQITREANAQVVGQKLSFNPKLNGLRCSVSIAIPREKFFTKAGAISKTSGDADNSLKYLIDSIFVALPDLNDAFITELIVKKMTGKKRSVTVKLESVAL